MTVLDDEIGDLLTAFRADEGVLDDLTRDRIWARISVDVPDAAEALDALAPPADVRRLRPRRPHGRHRILVAAAAVLVLLAVAGVVLRPGPGRDDKTVTAGTTESEVVVSGLDELADAVAARPVTALGSTPDAAYVHIVTEQVATTEDGTATTIDNERWIAPDGTGRIISDVRGDDRTPHDATFDVPGRLSFGGAVAIPALLELPDDAAAAEDLFTTAAGDGLTGRDVVVPVIDALMHPGIPAPARAGMLRFLARMGFTIVPAPGLSADQVRIEGVGPGYLVRAEIDTTTGLVLTRTWRRPTGSSDVRTVISTDLRSNTQGG